MIIKENNCMGVLSDYQTTSHLKNVDVAKKGTLKRETESLPETNPIRTIHIKARIDKTQPNSRCRLFSDWDETLHRKISECCKLTQKE